MISSSGRNSPSITHSALAGTFSPGIVSDSTSSMGSPRNVLTTSYSSASYGQRNILSPAVMCTSVVTPKMKAAGMFLFFSLYLVR